MNSLCITTNRKTNVTRYYFKGKRVSKERFDWIRHTASTRDTFRQINTATHYRSFSEARGYIE